MIGAGKLTKQGLLRPPQSANLEGSVTTITDAESKFGTHSLFVGGFSHNSYLTVRRSRSNLFGLTSETVLSGTGQGTIEFWMLNTGLNYTTTFNTMYDQQEVSTEIAILLRNNNTLAARARFGATTYETGYFALGTVGTWNHIALTLEDNVYLTLWINGSRIGTIGNGTDTLVTSGGTWNRLGINGSHLYFNEYRLSTNVRYNRANSTYTVPTAPFVNDEYTYWLFHFDENDAIATNAAALSGNMQISTEQSKFGDNSFKSDGTADYLLVRNLNGEFNYGTGNFTIEMWIYPTEVATTQYVYDARGSTQNGPTIYFTSTGVLNYYATGTNRISGGTVVANSWQHIALSRSGTSTRLFLNGTQVGSTWSDSTNYNDGNPLISLGSSQNLSTQALRGYIDEIRISNSARYTSNFTPATSEFTSDANTLLLLHAESSEVTDTSHRQCFDDVGQ
jgi:hypothetical protein